MAGRGGQGEEGGKGRAGRVKRCEGGVREMPVIWGVEEPPWHMHITTNTHALQAHTTSQKHHTREYNITSHGHSRAPLLRIAPLPRACAHTAIIMKRFFLKPRSHTLAPDSSHSLPHPHPPPHPPHTPAPAAAFPMPPPPPPPYTYL
jgi:hypothetical protein